MSHNLILSYIISHHIASSYLVLYHLISSHNIVSHPTILMGRKAYKHSKDERFDTIRYDTNNFLLFIFPSLGVLVLGVDKYMDVDVDVGMRYEV